MRCIKQIAGLCAVALPLIALNQARPELASNGNAVFTAGSNLVEVVVVVISNSSGWRLPTALPLPSR